MSPNRHSYYLSQETACKLINEVKTRPCLWDQEDENYTSRFMTATAWKEVAKNVALKGTSVIAWYFRSLSSYSQMALEVS